MRLGPVFIQAGHCKPTLGWNAPRVIHGNEAVRVARIPDDENANIGCGVLFNRLSLAGEDLAVNAEKIVPFHSSLAGNASHEKCPVRVFEAFIEVAGGHDIREQRKRTIFELHDNALEGIHCGRNFEKVQSNRLVGTKHASRSDTEEQ